MRVFFIQYACGSCALVDEQHAVVFVHLVAEHQAARALGVVVGDLDVVALAVAARPTGPHALAQPASSSKDANSRADGADGSASSGLLQGRRTSGDGRRSRQGGVARAICNEFAPTPFPSPAASGTMRAPSTGAGGTAPAGSKKSRHEVLTDSEKGCMMCGSLGHFGAAGPGEGAEADPTIFDSVRR